MGVGWVWVCGMVGVMAMCGWCVGWVCLCVLAGSVLPKRDAEIVSHSGRETYLCTVCVCVCLCVVCVLEGLCAWLCADLKPSLTIPREIGVRPHPHTPRPPRVEAPQSQNTAEPDPERPERVWGEPCPLVVRPSRSTSHTSSTGVLSSFCF